MNDAVDLSTPVKHTPLHALHVELGAKMVPFAGYDMPVNYPAGILKEHLHTRAQAGLFDVSHMGQLRLTGDQPAAALETLVPGDIHGLGLHRTRYTLFTGDQGGILDDLMVTNAGDHLFLVVNAACKEADLAHLRARLSGGSHGFGAVDIEPLEDRALLALQGPTAAAVLARFEPDVARMPFMSFGPADIRGIAVWLTRSGYTGEDGFEISVAAAEAEPLARLLLDQPEVMPIGLGARDTLRLEAGLCLYGHDIDTTTTPIEAGLTWTVGKRRRLAGGFPGADVIIDEILNGVTRKRVGIRPEGRAPARDHTLITADDGLETGVITSGGFGPTVNGPIAMGYVGVDHAALGTRVSLIVRGRQLGGQIVDMPFVPHRYYRG